MVMYVKEILAIIYYSSLEMLDNRQNCPTLDYRKNLISMAAILYSIMENPHDQNNNFLLSIP
jgi:hypothetical protein